MPPPLSYSIPSFHAGDYDGIEPKLERLRELGFRWVTFTPAALVREVNGGRDLVIETTRTPTGGLRDGLRRAVEMGFDVKLEPHLDFASLLEGDASVPWDLKWRRRMYFDLRPYYALLLRPMMDSLMDALPLGPGAHAAFTLGSELDVSVMAFTRQWAEVLGRLMEQRGDAPVALGHKVNHDFLDFPGGLRDSLHTERTRRGLPETTRGEWRDMQDAARAYLQQLDYASFSFYAGVRADADEQAVARAFRDRARSLARGVRYFDIGEFGLGSPDVSKPWEFEGAAGFLDANGRIHPHLRERRQRFYLGFLRFLRDNEALFDAPRPHPVTFWTVTHYDFLNALGQDYAVGPNPHAAEEFGDDVLREAVREYNRS